MSEPTIYVIPEAYYGGVAPKKVSRKETSFSARSSSAPTTSSARSSRDKWIFFSITGVLFLIVLGGSIWYFTRGLRPAAPIPASVPAQNEIPPLISEPPVVPVPEVSAPSEPPAEPTPSSDADNDGLTQVEEVLYGSQPTVPDTDSDGFLDGHETLNLYNPSGIAPERLEDTGFVTRFKHPIYFYEFLYPKLWRILPEASARDLSFQSATGESIAISVMDNPNNISPRDFAVQTAPGPGAEISDWTSNKANVAGVLIKEAGGLRGVFGNGGLIYAVHYATPEGTAPAYLRTFEMMLNSLRIMN